MPQAAQWHQPARPRRKIWPWVLGGILLCGTALVALLMIGIFSAAMKGVKQGGMLTVSPGGQLNKTVIRRGGPERVAHIDLDGVITGSTTHGRISMVDQFENLINAAVADPGVKAIVVRIKSPGGEVTASDRLHRLLKQADASKPVIAYLDTIAASGGYYAACGSRHIVSHPSTFTGSIGVIMQSVKYRELIGKIGVSMEVYKSGELKDILSGSRETSPEEAELINRLVRETYTRFLEVVAANRGRSVEELLGSPMTDGRIFSGAQALAAGMVDQNGFIEDAYDQAMSLAGVSNATVVRFASRPGIWETFSLMGRAPENNGRIEIDVSDRLVPRLQTGVPLYLHPGSW
jgi:protease-4